jgi:hypothetical protein
MTGKLLPKADFWSEILRANGAGSVFPATEAMELISKFHVCASAPR